tara:strand:- start:19304 stop:20695 length:1392 start_codon:yes stop_codon:yes gene_type:complete
MKKYLIEICGKKYIGFDQQWQQIETDVFSAANSNYLNNEDFYLVTDFNYPINSREIQGDIKYSDVLLAKQLRDEGEVVGSVQIVTSEKYRLNTQTNFLFYQSVPLADYNKYINIANNTLSHRLLVPYAKIFPSLIRNHGDKVGCGVVLINKGEEFDLVIYNNGKIIASKNIRVYENELDDEALIHNLSDAISRVAASTQAKITSFLAFDWIRETAESPKWQQALAEKLNLKVLPVNTKEIYIDGVKQYSTLIDYIDDMTVSSSISSSEERYNYMLEQALPVVAMIMLVVNLWFGYDYWQTQKSISYNRFEVANVVQELEDARRRDKARPDIIANEELIKEYQLIRGDINIVSFEQVLEKLALANPSSGDVYIESILVTYPNKSPISAGNSTRNSRNNKNTQKPSDRIVIQVAGEIVASEIDHEIVFNDYIQNLNNQNLAVTDSLLGGDSANFFAMDIEVLSNE